MRKSKIDKMMESNVCQIGGCSNEATKQISVLSWVEDWGEEKHVFASVCEDCYKIAHKSRKIQQKKNGGQK